MWATAAVGFTHELLCVSLSIVPGVFGNYHILTVPFAVRLSHATA